MQRITSLFILLLFTSNMCSQETEADFLFYPQDDIKWRFYGVNYESVNQNFGFSFSNGLKEQPLIHFEVLNESILYDVKFQTNFEKDYIYGIEIGYDYPFRPFSLIDVSFQQKNLVSQNYFQRDVSIGGLFRIGLPGSFITRIGYQTLNESDNFGLTLGWQESIKFNKKNAQSDLYFGFMYADYNEHNWYRAFVRGFLFQEKISYSVSYDRVSSYDFINFSLKFVILKVVPHENHQTR